MCSLNKPSSILTHESHVDQVAGAPVALDEAPRPGDVDCVPRVAEVAALELDARLVACGLAVALDHDAV